MKITITIEAEGQRPKRFVGDDESPDELTRALHRFLDTRATGGRMSLSKDPVIARYQLDFYFRLKTQGITDIDSPEARKVYVEFRDKFTDELQQEAGRPLKSREMKSERDRLYKALIRRGHYERSPTGQALRKGWTLHF